MDTVSNFISTFMIAISCYSLYSKEHEAFNELVKKSFLILNGILGERLEIMIIENDLIINKKPYRDSGIKKTNLINRLKRKGIHRVDFSKGLSLSEMKTFIIDIAEPGKGIKPYPHIKAGSIDVHLIKPGIDSADTGGLYNLSSEIMEKVRDIFPSISPFKKLNIAGLDEIVLHFIATFKKEAKILELLSPVKSFSEYTYTHATNVAVLSMFQAKSLGMEDEFLHEIGVAALLHDVGKLFIPKEILEKKGKLDDKEFDEIKKHPAYGARYLAKMDSLTRLAPIIAFEHHMKYDCSGYPRLQLHEKKQHIMSQIVSISDFFDALRSRRPYRESLDARDIIILMKESVDKDFSPFLLSNFINSLQIVLPQ